MKMILVLEFSGVDPDSSAADELLDGLFSPNGLDELANMLGADCICVEDCLPDEEEVEIGERGFFIDQLLPDEEEDDEDDEGEAQ